MKGLIKRLEAAECGSRELDCRVVAWSEGVLGGEHWSNSDLAYALSDPDRTCNPEPVTTSLDAALALAERVGLDVLSVCNEAAEGLAVGGWSSSLRTLVPELARYACIVILKATTANTVGTDGEAGSEPK